MLDLQMGNSRCVVKFRDQSVIHLGSYLRLFLPCWDGIFLLPQFLFK